MSRIGLIVGSGELPWTVDWQPVGSRATAYGEASMAPEIAQVSGCDVIRLARHGVPHHIAPHAVNYRANLRALADLEVDAVIALNTVGGITPLAATGALVIPEQIIDYTWGRVLSFSPDDAVAHIDFGRPYDEALRAQLREAAAAAGVAVQYGGTMGVTQGPRLETAAEIARMARDGCDLVGMTGMPEAALARELAMPFASVSLVVNPAAGVGGVDLVDLEDIRRVAAQAMLEVGALLGSFFERLYRLESGD